MGRKSNNDRLATTTGSSSPKKRRLQSYFDDATGSLTNASAELRSRVTEVRDIQSLELGYGLQELKARERKKR